MAKSMYDIIKKQNGEHFAKAIRNYDNGIFDIPNLDKMLKYAGRDAEPLMRYLMSLKDIQIEEQVVHMDPIALLNEAGYDAYVADTLQKQNAIKKYFEPDERLCTFYDETRYQRYYIINAVRKDVDKIKRAPIPQREDEYGTSVISIQVLKEGGFISIKNRYNHTVMNPDNTFGSNPDNIISGLSDAIRWYFGVDFTSPQIALPNNYIIVCDQIVKYDYERNGVFCGEYHYARDSKVVEIDKLTEIMLGAGILLNVQHKTVRDVTGNGIGDESIHKYKFVLSLHDAIKDKKILVSPNRDGGRDIFADGVKILTVTDGRLSYLNLPNAKSIYLKGNSSFLTGALDFSNASYLLIQGVDMRGVTEMKMPRRASHVDLLDCALPKGNLDLSGVRGVAFVLRSSMSDVTGISMPDDKNSQISFGDLHMPAIHLHCKNLNALYMTNVGASNMTGLTIGRIKTADFSNSSMPMTELDFRGVMDLRCMYTDFTKVPKVKLLRYQHSDIMITGPVIDYTDDAIYLIKRSRKSLFNKAKDILLGGLNNIIGFTKAQEVVARNKKSH